MMKQMTVNTKDSVKENQGATIVLIDVLWVAAVMDAMMRRSVLQWKR